MPTKHDHNAHERRQHQQLTPRLVLLLCGGSEDEDAAGPALLRNRRVLIFGHVSRHNSHLGVGAVCVVEAPIWLQL